MKPRKPGTQKLLTLDFLLLPCNLFQLYLHWLFCPSIRRGNGGRLPASRGCKERSRVLPKTSAVLYDERKYSPPVGYGTAEYEDMPYCMEMTMRIVGKEIGAYRI